MPMKRSASVPVSQQRRIVDYLPKYHPRSILDDRESSSSLSPPPLGKFSPIRVASSPDKMEIFILDKVDDEEDILELEMLQSQSSWYETENYSLPEQLSSPIKRHTSTDETPIKRVLSIDATWTRSLITPSLDNKFIQNEIVTDSWQVPVKESSPQPLLEPPDNEAYELWRTCILSPPGVDVASLDPHLDPEIMLMNDVHEPSSGSAESSIHLTPTPLILPRIVSTPLQNVLPLIRSSSTLSETVMDAEVAPLGSELSAPLENSVIELDEILSESETELEPKLLNTELETELEYSSKLKESPISNNPTQENWSKVKDDSSPLHHHILTESQEMVQFINEMSTQQIHQLCRMTSIDEEMVDAEKENQNLNQNSVSITNDNESKSLNAPLEENNPFLSTANAATVSITTMHNPLQWNTPAYKKSVTFSNIAKDDLITEQYNATEFKRFPDSKDKVLNENVFLDETPIKTTTSTNFESGFSTAKGKPITVSKEKIQQMAAFLDETPIRPSTTVFTSGFSTGKGKPVAISEERIQQMSALLGETPLKANPVSSTAKGRPISVSKEKLQEMTTFLDETPMVSKSSNFVSHTGFSTAKGKAIPISEERIQAMSKLFDETPIKSNNITSHSNSGFSTAKGKPITISEEKLQQMTRLLDETPIKSHPPSIKMGFSSAKGKPITVSKEKLEQMNQFLNEETLPFTTPLMKSKLNKSIPIHSEPFKRRNPLELKSISTTKKSSNKKPFKPPTSSLFMTPLKRTASITRKWIPTSVFQLECPDNKRQSFIQYFNGQAPRPRLDSPFASWSLMDIERNFMTQWEEIHALLLQTLTHQHTPPSVEWSRNHLKWIYWKLVSYERCIEKGNFLSSERVLQQLLYRYERETVQGHHSYLKRLSEQDVDPSVPCCLLVSALDEENSKLSLSDGWYSLWVQCPSKPFLSRLKLGQKLYLMHLQWVQPLPCALHPLERLGNEMPVLVLPIHCCRRAHWALKLGRQRQRLRVSFSSILQSALQFPQGGLCADVSVKIVKRFPLLFVEKLETHSIVRQEKEEWHYLERAQALNPERKVTCQWTLLVTGWEGNNSDNVNQSHSDQNPNNQALITFYQPNETLLEQFKEGSSWTFSGLTLSNSTPHFKKFIANHRYFHCQKLFYTPLYQYHSFISCSEVASQPRGSFISMIAYLIGTVVSTVLTHFFLLDQSGVFVIVQVSRKAPEFQLPCSVHELIHCQHLQVHEWDPVERVQVLQCTDFCVLKSVKCDDTFGLALKHWKESLQGQFVYSSILDKIKKWIQ